MLHHTVGSDLFLQGQYVGIGIAGAGNFGTSNAASSGFNVAATATVALSGAGADTSSAAESGRLSILI